MELDLLKNILIISPGFFGVAAHKLFTGDAGNISVQQNILMYFLYSSIAWIGTALLPLSPTYAIGAAMIGAVMLAILWNLFIKDFLIWVANKLLSWCGKNPIRLNRYALDTALLDGEHHYLTIHQHGEIIGSGFFTNVLTPENSIILKENKEWAEYFATNEHDRRFVVYLDKDTYIEEHILP